MGKRYDYVDVATCRVGLMRCCVCGKKITTGQYRYHETTKAYVPCHRACCEGDPMWAKLDQEEEERQAYEAAYKAACDEFLAKWGSFPEEDCPYCSS